MSQLDLIFGKLDDTALDPICQMVVQKANPPGGTAEYGDKTYYFCAPGCQQEFRERPERYV